MKKEIVKCANPKTELPMCRECQRNSTSKDNEYQAFNAEKSKCDGYVSKRETESLF